MKDLAENLKYMRKHPVLGWGDKSGGYFRIPERGLDIVASNGGGWDHVSVSLLNRCPTWDEMEFVKRLFFRDTEAAFQLHPPIKDYKNIMPYCLHLWRPQAENILLPPVWMVAP